MRRDKWIELKMLRELVWLLVGAKKVICHFCPKPILCADRLTFGHHHHPPIVEEITVHHIDHNRENNHPSNLALCHRECHKRYHRNVTIQAMKGAPVRKEGDNG